jgi:MFS family permease
MEVCFSSISAVIFILFFIYGIYAAATEGIVKAWITNIAHDTNTATAVGFYTSCQSICSLLASIIAGFIWSSIWFFIYIWRHRFYCVFCNNLFPIEFQEELISHYIYLYSGTKMGLKQ